jgi:hypothetical protein
LLSPRGEVFTSAGLAAAKPTPVLSFISSAMAQLSLYSSGIFNDSVISAGCTSALKGVLACDPYWVELTSADLYTSLGDNSTQDALCSSACKTSLATYHNTVASACAHDPNPWSGIPATWASDAIWSTFNRTCLKDPSSNIYCTGEKAIGRL